MREYSQNCDDNFITNSNAIKKGADKAPFIKSSS